LSLFAGPAGTGSAIRTAAYVLSPAEEWSAAVEEAINVATKATLIIIMVETRETPHREIPGLFFYRDIYSLA